MARIRSIKPEFWPRDGQASPFRCAIYLIREEGDCYAKIGIAIHPVRRRSILQCGNPRRLILSAVYEAERGTCAEIEKAARRHFGIPAGTEWFRDTDGQAVAFLEQFIGEDAQ